MIRFLAAAILFGSLASAAEEAVLRSGYRLSIDRHEREGGEYVLYSGDGGETRVAVEQIVAFEPIEAPVPGPAPTPTPRTSGEAAAGPRSLRTLVDDAARKHGLPVGFVHAVVAAESAYRPDAVSPKGAIGLMQLMPGTALELGADPRDPEQNLEAGVRYLRELLIKYSSDANRALAAYNAGPGAVDRYGDVPPYRETQTYVHRVLTNYLQARQKEPPAAK